MEDLRIIEGKIMRPRTLEEHYAQIGTSPEVIAGVKQAVENGVAWLDEHNPNWFDRFQKRFDEFDITSPHQCVLGISFGEYNEALQRNNLAWWESVDLGFNIIDPGEDGEYLDITSHFPVEHPDEYTEDALALELEQTYPGCTQRSFTTTEENRTPWDWQELQMMWTFYVENRLGLLTYVEVEQYPTKAVVHGFNPHGKEFVTKKLPSFDLAREWTEEAMDLANDSRYKFTIVDLVAGEVHYFHPEEQLSTEDVLQDA